MTEPHEDLSCWRPDEVAECLDISNHLSERLWMLMDEMGSHEWPEIIDEEHSVMAIWHRLTEDERKEINDAYEQYD